MQALGFKQILTHRLTPQQIQLVKLLQVPAIDIKARIERELSENPALEQAQEAPEEKSAELSPTSEAPADLGEEEPRWGYRQYDSHADRMRREATIPVKYSLYDRLLEQFHYLQLDEKQRKIGEYLLGNLEDDGYIRRDLEVIVNDLACNEYVRAHTHEVEAVLKKIQQLDPPGIAARNLQECLLIQLQKAEKKPARQLAIQIVTETFPAFIRKHYDTILKKLEVADRALFREAIALISKLNPKPRIDDGASLHRQLVYPDFIVTQREGQLRVSLRSYYTPELSVSKRYAALLSEYETPQRKDKHMREAATFVKQRLTAAQWFIEAIKQRQQTLLHTMETIVKLQHDFFIEEEEQNLKPMILKDVAQEMQADISTISRVVNNKSVQTDLAIYPLKFFFTEGIHTTSGTEVSNRVVKQALAKLIREEDKQKPYPDHKLVDMLQAQGYDIARRTVAKYREQMHMPVARMRREV